MRQAAVIGPYLRHNFGDDLVGGVIAKHLQGMGYSVTIPFLGEENAHWLGTRHTMQLDESIDAADTIVIGGGGILSDVSGAKPGTPYLETISRAALTGRLAGKATYITSVGAGPWLVEASKAYTIISSLVAEKIGVRDPESGEHLAGLGVNVSKIVQGADLALLCSDYLPFSRAPHGKIGLQFDVSIFEDVLRNGGAGDIRRAMKTYAEANSESVVLLSNSERDSQLRGPATAKCLGLNYSHLESFLPKLAGLDAILTSHLHLSVAAYSQRIPCFSLYVREKTRRFYEQIGHPERAVDLATAEVNDFERLVAEVESASWTDEDEEVLQRLKGEARTLLDFVR
jgi:polysaccharide pyruvyl transferase WcaK-like protein